MHYSQEDFKLLGGELRRKGFLFGGIFAVYLAFSIYCVIARLEMACTIVSAIFLPIFFFFFCVYLMPPIRYHRFLRDVFESRRHERELIFLRYEPDIDVREGVRFYPVIVLDNEGYEHRLYWDELKERLPLVEGQEIRVTTFGQNIVALEA